MNPVHQELEILGKLLDVAALRHRVIAGNISNINTPNFHRYEVKFETMLTDALQKNDMKRASALNPKVVVDDSGPEKEDGNNVSLEQEVGDLMKNTLYFETVSQLLSRKIATIRTAISGRN